jgi:two-component system nitrogen regulation response regulator GlnG/two-component system response regulator HydG
VGVGESPAAYRLRDLAAFHAKASTNVLLLGPSGSGKELAARAIHRLSRRADRPWVARNAATFPAGLIDAELFGNPRNYPNPGMAERPGLIGQADGGTLFLDEIGELPAELQAHLLRVLDGDGEYHRLGEAAPRRADLRLVAATNRDAQALKHDLLARLTLRLRLPGLEERREDIPLLARHLLKQAAARDPEVAARFVADKGAWAGEPRIDPALVDHLVRHHFAAHLRELETLLWQAMAGSRHYYVALTEEVLAHWTPAPRPAREDPRPADPPVGLDEAPPPAQPGAPPEPTLDEIRAAIAAADGNLARAARALGLSRYALYRVLRKHGIDAADVRDPD